MEWEIDRIPIQAGQECLHSYSAPPANLRSSQRVLLIVRFIFFLKFKNITGFAIQSFANGSKSNLNYKASNNEALNEALNEVLTENQKVLQRVGRKDISCVREENKKNPEVINGHVK